MRVKTILRGGRETAKSQKVRVKPKNLAVEENRS